MSKKISDKLSVPIDWDRILTGSTGLIVLIFILGLIFKIRVLLALAEILIVGLLITTISIFFISVVKKYTSNKDNSK